MTNKTDVESRGIIGKTTEKGLPVIWSFDNVLPEPADREGLPWLTVISWKYDGSERNGMPSNDTNQRMLALEDALYQLEIPGQCISVYRRTGNNLKEFTYYIHDKNAFITQLNVALKDHAQYPIEIKFYEDKDWSDFRKLLADFSSTPTKH